MSGAGVEAAEEGSMSGRMSWARLGGAMAAALLVLAGCARGRPGSRRSGRRGERGDAGDVRGDGRRGVRRSGDPGPIPDAGERAAGGELLDRRAAGVDRGRPLFLFPLLRARQRPGDPLPGGRRRDGAHLRGAGDGRAQAGMAGLDADRQHDPDRARALRAMGGRHGAGAGEPAGFAGDVPLPGRTGHDVPHPRHLCAVLDRRLGLGRLHPDVPAGRHEPLRAGTAGRAGARAGPARVRPRDGAAASV